MGTFKRKPETVDARQFTGGKENGMALVLWVNSVGGSSVRARWDVIYGGTEVIHLIHPNEVETAFVDDWIVHRQNGTLDVVRPQVFDNEFDQV